MVSNKFTIGLLKLSTVLGLDIMVLYDILLLLTIIIKVINKFVNNCFIIMVSDLHII
jgi:hypothetical protein